MSIEDVPVGFIVETNKGGIPIKVCACGVLMVGPMADAHLEHCPVYRMSRREVEDEMG